MQNHQNVRFRSFTSTSNGGGEFNGNLLFKITSKTGVNISKLSLYPNETEILFAARTEFEVRSVTKTPSGKLIVEMSEVSDIGSPTAVEKSRTEMTDWERRHIEDKMQSGDLRPELVPPRTPRQS
jgi:hypothetical protein